MTEYARQQMQKRSRSGKLLTLILLIYGLAVTLLYFFSDVPQWFVWLAPFNLAGVALQNWFDPALFFVPLAVIALAAWLLLHVGRLFGREILIGAMILYLAANLVFTPFYLLIVSSTWQVSSVGTILGLSLSGTIYPILVLVALHRWNPRNK